jgi:glycosyltransferase involved in cell wall biosynthesis
LDEALHSIYDQPQGGSFETILVNNGFPAERVPGLLARFPGLLIIDEKTPGHAAALRAGFRAARGDFFVCLDDDNLLGEGFFPALESLIAANPNLGVVTPAVVPKWEKTPPMWLQKFGLSCLSYTATAAPAGTSPKREQVWASPDFKGWPWPPGGGMIIHRSLAKDYLSVEGGNLPKIGRVGNTLGGCHDQDICSRVVGVGRDAAFSEKLLIFHQIPAARTRMSYLWQLNFRMSQDWAKLQRKWKQENHPFAVDGVGGRIRDSLRLPDRLVRGLIPFPRFWLELASNAGFVLGWTKDCLQNGHEKPHTSPAAAFRKT